MLAKVKSANSATGTHAAEESRHKPADTRHRRLAAGAEQAGPAEPLQTAGAGRHRAGRPEPQETLSIHRPGRGSKGRSRRGV